MKYFPYQLNPDAPKEGEDKYEWYKKSRYGDSEEKMKMVSYRRSHEISMSMRGGWEGGSVKQGRPETRCLLSLVAMLTIPFRMLTVYYVDDRIW